METGVCGRTADSRSGETIFCCGGAAGRLRLHGHSKFAVSRRAGDLRQSLWRRARAFVALDFEPANGYWRTADATALIRRAADFGRQAPATFSVETLFATVRPGEIPVISIHLRPLRGEAAGEVKVQLMSGGKSLETMNLPVQADGGDTISVQFHTALAAGFYEVAATWSEQRHVREFYRNGFWVSPADMLLTGQKLGVQANILTRDGKPFMPVGTNVFGTEENGWDFSGPRNAAGWEHDFVQMHANGVSFIRTGVWMPNARFVDGDLGAVNERFLRNLEAFLLSAQRHGIAVNFTFYAFAPKVGNPRQDDTLNPAQNPFLDSEMLRHEQSYIRSTVSRFRSVPFLSWDLVNEPSFSNPRNVFKGNYPNNDPSEIAAWHKWLRERYGQLTILADAWSDAGGTGNVRFDCHSSSWRPELWPLWQSASGASAGL